ncbi:SCO0930 family lipoprotein [Actinomadura sp. 6N118]|uniref:SCO0930 family lipoprotein n=1 Tax=Actinomadura sp. 6N118 TaxID=3375151 RepID=UPI0037B5964A
MEFPRWAIPAAAALTASGVLLTACGQETGGNQKNTSAGSAQQVQQPQQPQQPANEPAAPESPALEVASVSKLGKVVTDGEGRTLYRFDKDTARPPASTCLEECATAWPPVMASQAAVQVKGVDESLVGKVKRPDGKWQVTLGGWPLYRYAKDQSPGDANGQGVQGTWYAAAPTGKKAAAKAAEPNQPPQQNEGGGGGGGWAGWTTIKVRQDPALGMIVTDGKGRTMYRFDKDKPKVSNCFGDCRAKWPIVRFNGFKKLKVSGVDKSLISFIERKDGKPGECQLLINGWPMYYFAKDAKAGDTKGQAVQNVWWAVSPEGKKITAKAGGGDGGGYGGGY